MNDATSRRPAPGESSEALRELHQLYLQFVTELGNERDRDYPQLAYPDFVAWWRKLGPVVRDVWERAFRQGYTATIEEGERQVAAFLSQYDQPTGGGPG